jgi:hypothetical protein
MAPTDRLEALSGGFRERYLRYEELTEQLRRWAEAFPELARLESLGASEEGRPLWLLRVGPEPERARPSVWVDGNMHAVELCGSSVALAIAEDVLRLHLDPGLVLPGLSRAATETLREVCFFVLPRMSPDGAECVLDTGRYVRSAPRDRRPNREHARWLTGDVDGDGLALLMRLEDPTGEFVESPELAGLLLPRRLEDDGPFYKVYPEGVIENFDGHHVPNPSFLSDNDVDLNRNFPFSWAPAFRQEGAGSHPLSEPESRAVVEFASRHPEIFAWLNFHTFGGVFIRPLGDQPDAKMDREDLALYRQIGAWAEELTGYPMVSGFEEFTYEPEKPLCGDLSDFAYHQRGCISYVVELWDLFQRAGIERKKRFVDTYSHLTREDLIKLARFDRDHNQGRALRRWKPHRHPQLGEVEIGGIDPRFGIWNPTFEELGEVCAAHSACFLRVAALAPRLAVARLGREELEGGANRVRFAVENRGYLPTHVLSSAKKLDFSEPLHARVEARGGLELAAPEDARREIGHLDGWGRGLHEAAESIYFQRSRGSTGRRILTYVVRGRGLLDLRVGSCRTGWIGLSEEI